MLNTNFLKTKIIRFCIKLITNYVTKPQLKVDTIEKRKVKNKIMYYVTFIIVRRRQPFKLTVDYIIYNIGRLNFNKTDIVILSFYQMYQMLENAENENETKAISI